MERREFIRTASGLAAGTAAGAAAASGASPAVAQAEEPDWPSFVEEAPNFGTSDQRGESEVTVQVGAGDGFQFEPSAIWIDPGTTVIWEWTGEGGQHNVVTEADASTEGAELSAPLQEAAGATYEHTFGEDADGSITAYYCEPHIGLDMKGGVAVGEVPTREAPGGDGGGGGQAGVPVPDTARILGVATAVALGATLGLTYLFMRYGGEAPPEPE